MGQMLVAAALPLGLQVRVIDPTPHCPAAIAGADQVCAPLSDEHALTLLTDSCYVTTFEIEHGNHHHLQNLEERGAVIYPSPRVLEIIADKARQKAHFLKAGIPLPQTLAHHVTSTTRYPHPVIQKARHGGYDGRGVALVSANAAPPLSDDSYIEEVIEIERELAVITVVDARGEIFCYEPVEMRFVEELNLVDEVSCPVELPEETLSHAIAIARRACQSLVPLGLRGVLAVELFLTPSGEIYLNEVAPRPHNSGHHTIEACEHSQFEQHVRAVMGYPIAATSRKHAVVMRNIVGPTGCDGAYHVTGRATALTTPGVHLHLYQKHTARAGRKMGHLTACAQTVSQARQRAAAAINQLSFEARPREGLV